MSLCFYCVRSCWKETTASHFLLSVYQQYNCKIPLPPYTRSLFLLSAYQQFEYKIPLPPYTISLFLLSAYQQFEYKIPRKKTYMYTIPSTRLLCYATHSGRDLTTDSTVGSCCGIIAKQHRLPQRTDTCTPYHPQGSCAMPHTVAVISPQTIQ